VLIVDQQRSVREGGLLQKTGQCLAGEPMASAGSHEAIYLDHVQTSLLRFYRKSQSLFAAASPKHDGILGLRPASGTL
jgi:hypothetical protein